MPRKISPKELRPHPSRRCRPIGLGPENKRSLSKERNNFYNLGFKT